MIGLEYNNVYLCLYLSYCIIMSYWSSFCCDVYSCKFNVCLWSVGLKRCELIWMFTMMWDANMYGTIHVNHLHTVYSRVHTGFKKYLYYVYYVTCQKSYWIVCEVLFLCVPLSLRHLNYVQTYKREDCQTIKYNVISNLFYGAYKFLRIRSYLL